MLGSLPLRLRLRLRTRSGSLRLAGSGAEQAQAEGRKRDGAAQYKLMMSQTLPPRTGGSVCPDTFPTFSSVPYRARTPMRQGSGRIPARPS